MIERPSRRPATSPAWARIVRLADKVFGAMSRRRLISPAARPSGPARTNSRKMVSRPSWASEDRADAGELGLAEGWGGKFDVRLAPESLTTLVVSLA